MRQQDVASSIGLSVPAYQRYEYGTAKKRKTIKALGDYYKCSLSWLQTGEGEPHLGGDRPATISIDPETYTEPGACGIAGEFVFIPQMAGALSAGGGLAPEDQVEMRVAFRQDWISRKGSPQNMSLIKVKGDSMEPTLLPGDLVLVDHSKNAVVRGGIYAVALDHEIMIKRLQPLPAGKVLVISDNKQYTSIETNPQDIHVNGQVLWYAREIER